MDEPLQNFAFSLQPLYKPSEFVLEYNSQKPHCFATVIIRSKGSGGRLHNSENLVEPVFWTLLLVRARIFKRLWSPGIDSKE